MNISNIQSQLAYNRHILAVLHGQLQHEKQERTHFSRNGLPDLAEAYQKEIVKTRKIIAKLVVLQKALKKDMATALEYQKVAKNIDNLLKNLVMAQAGEAF